MPKSGWRVKSPEKFIEQLVQALHDVGDEIFAISQENVPVDTGTLKKSGTVEKLNNGVRITYRTTYAATQEFGIEPGTTQRVKKHTVKKHVVKASTRYSHGVRSHSYTTKHGTKVVVKNYTVKTYQIPRHEVGPYEVGPYTRTFKDGMKGKFYLTDAFLAMKPRLVDFIKRITGE